ncbi:MAG: ethanolamine utilization protein EutN [Planctomycetes bacterium]|nr:ethanolamine utilization protein EutN [Planctomycetota bacterium]
MLLGRVVGTVWATRHDPSLDNAKFLVVRQLKLDGTLADNFVVAVDAVGAGVGERVLVAQGSSGRQTEQTKNRPVDAVVMAIVDNFEVAQRDWKAFDAIGVRDVF